MDLPRRKRIRLPEHDHSAPGAYFVTICTKDRRCVLSRIAVGEGLAPPAAELSPIGQYVKEQILKLPDRYPTVHIDNYAIMPNHVHLLVSIHADTGGARDSPTVRPDTGGARAAPTFRPDSGGASPSPTLFDVVRVLKSLSTRLSREHPGDLPLWQRSFHEHVIRNERDYREIWEYIDANPAKWAEDRYYKQ